MYIHIHVTLNGLVEGTCSQESPAIFIGGMLTIPSHGWFMTALTTLLYIYL